jgi:hypothetical protein
VVVGSTNFTTELGAAYVFTRAGTTWTQTQELTDTSIHEFGYSVSLSGGTVVVGGDTFEVEIELLMDPEHLGQLDVVF